jgi:2,4-diaminopentanoate dehydrogenase
MAMIFESFGKKLKKYKEKIVPVIAKKQTTTEHFDVAEGLCIGLKQTAKGIDENGNIFCTMNFIAFLDNKEDRDTIKLNGSPNLKVTLEGTNGDIGTAAITINAIPRVVNHSAGLVTMKDLPIVSCGQ